MISVQKGNIKLLFSLLIYFGLEFFETNLKNKAEHCTLADVFDSSHSFNSITVRLRKDEHKTKQ